LKFPLLLLDLDNRRRRFAFFKAAAVAVSFTRRRAVAFSRSSGPTKWLTPKKAA
jgi:hypothetical protein